MKSFYTLLAVPALFTSAFAAPTQKPRQVPLSDVVSTVQGLLSDVTSAAGQINIAVASGNTTEALANVQVNLDSLITSVEGVVDSIVGGTVSNVTSAAQDIVSDVVTKILSTIDGTLTNVTVSGVTTSTITNQVSTLTSSLTGLLSGLQGLGVTSIVGTVTSVVGGLPLVGQVVSLLAGLGQSVGGNLLGGILKN